MNSTFASTLYATAYAYRQSRTPVAVAEYDDIYIMLFAKFVYTRRPADRGRSIRIQKRIWKSHPHVVRRTRPDV